MYKIIGADGNQYGPCSLTDLQGWIRERRANGDTLAQGPGMNDWKPLREFPEFAQVLQETYAAGLAAAPMAVAAPAPAVNAAEAVAGPAVGLMVVGALVALGNVAALLSNLLGLAMPMPQPVGDPQMEQFIKLMSGTVGVVSSIVGILLGAVTVAAGWQMRQLKNYGFAMAMLVINMIPCCNSCCCLIGLPIGIWGITVLMKPEIKSAFH